MQKRKRLLQSQKELLIQWIAEGLLTDEINKRAARCAEPFKVSRQQVDYYRKRCDKDIKEITQQLQFQALNTGLAVVSERVEKLKQLAELMEKDLFGGLLWTTMKKGIGAGNLAQILTYKEFNKAEVDSYRGVLDDIAAELGHRVQKSEVTADPDGEIHVTFHNPYAKNDQ